MQVLCRGVIIVNYVFSRKFSCWHIYNQRCLFCFCVCLYKLVYKSTFFAFLCLLTIGYKIDFFIFMILLTKVLENHNFALKLFTSSILQCNHIWHYICVQFFPIYRWGSFFIWIVFRGDFKVYVHTYVRTYVCTYVHM